jgi:prolyl-tRNA synthetase
MKDSYSFDVDEAGLDKSYEKHVGAYDRICRRCGVEFYRVESDSGFMGGAQAHEYIAPSPAGEDRIVVCESCGYAANVELARSVARTPVESGTNTGGGPADFASAGSSAPREVPTPEQRRIEQVSTFLGVSPASIIKALVYLAGDEPVMALVRGDHSLHESKLARHLKQEVRAATAEEVEKAVGIEVGFVGPVGVTGKGKLRLIADESLRPGEDVGGGKSELARRREYVAGANKPHTHLLGVVVGRDFEPEYADLREAEEGDGCPRCGHPLVVKQGIEVGNIFKLGTKYSVPLGATVLDESGAERQIIMGSYGIGPARVAAAAVEQRSDERGIIWPKAIAPFDVHVVQVQARDEIQTEVASALHDRLSQEGWEVLWDDRDERPGCKFADAELIGCPVRVTVGKRAVEGVVEVEPRQRGARAEVPLAECAEEVRRLWESAD